MHYNCVPAAGKTEEEEQRRNSLARVVLTSSPRAAFSASPRSVPSRSWCDSSACGPRGSRVFGAFTCRLTPACVDMEPTEANEGKTGSVSAAQRRAEMRRKKLLMNSEDRMNRIVGFAKSESEDNGRTPAGRSPQPRCLPLHPACPRGLVASGLFPRGPDDQLRPTSSGNEAKSANRA